MTDPVLTDEISDGYHTFGELYAHRRALTAALAKAMPMEAWRSKAHHPSDDPIFPGYFIVGVDLPRVGTVTYHYPMDAWGQFSHVMELTHAPKWDGAPAGETVNRLHAWASR